MNHHPLPHLNRPGLNECNDFHSHSRVLFWIWHLGKAALKTLLNCWESSKVVFCWIDCVADWLTVNQPVCRFVVRRAFAVLNGSIHYRHWGLKAPRWGLGLLVLDFFAHHCVCFSWKQVCCQEESLHVTRAELQSLKWAELGFDFVWHRWMCCLL